MIILTDVEIGKAIKDWVRKEYGKEADTIILHIRNGSIRAAVETGKK